MNVAQIFNRFKFPQARRLQKAGAVGGIVIDNSPSTSADAAPLFAMSGDGTEDVQVCSPLALLLIITPSSNCLSIYLISSILL